MLQCKECDYLKIEKNGFDVENCSVYRCQYTNYIFSGDDFYDTSEHPCSQHNIIK